MRGRASGVDEVAEYAALLEFAAAVGAMHSAEQACREQAAGLLAGGVVRPDRIADALGVSRATMYRWVKG